MRAEEIFTDPGPDREVGLQPHNEIQAPRPELLWRSSQHSQECRGASVSSLDVGPETSLIQKTQEHPFPPAPPIMASTAD